MLSEKGAFFLNSIMNENIPLFVSVIFILTVMIALGLFWRTRSKSSFEVIAILAIWLTFQAILTLRGFYLDTDVMPPRFLLLVAPPMLFIILLFVSPQGKRFIDSLDLKWLTLFHIVRVPVEITLLFLFVYGQVPQLMTFEGRNLDIISGITAPLAYFLYKQHENKKFLMTWNLICLGLLFNIVIHAILAAPLPFQQLAFEQPNVGVFYFPFSWLPGFIVPMALFCHLASIRRLISVNEKSLSY